jgi:hypothetical protein
MVNRDSENQYDCTSCARAIPHENGRRQRNYVECESVCDYKPLEDHAKQGLDPNAREIYASEEIEHFIHEHVDPSDLETEISMD